MGLPSRKVEPGFRHPGADGRLARRAAHGGAAPAVW